LHPGPGTLVGGVSQDEGEYLEVRRAVTPRSVRALSEMLDE
jgi:hypothetical protein